MENLVKTILGAGITFGLADRESFVKEVSGIIQEFQKNPEKSEKWAAAIIAYLENLRDKINMENAIKDAAGDYRFPDKTSVVELTAAINELTRTLQNPKQRG